MYKYRSDRQVIVRFRSRKHEIKECQKEHLRKNTDIERVQLNREDGEPYIYIPSFQHENDVFPFTLYIVHALLMLILLIYAYWCPKRCSCQMMFVLFNSNTMGVAWGTGTDKPSGVPEFTPGFQWSSCCSILSFLCSVLKIIVCPFALFLFTIVLSVLLRFTASDYPFRSSNFSFTLNFIKYKIVNPPGQVKRKYLYN